MKNLLFFIVLSFSFSSFGQTNFSIRRIDKINVRCNGENSGQIMVTTVVGGRPPYKYSLNGGTLQLSNNFPNLKAGSYTVTVSDSINRRKDSVILITQPARLGINFSVRNLNCNSDSTGSINARVSGGIFPYSYNWSNGSHAAQQNNLSAGLYILTVTDSINCAARDTVKITQPSALVATAVGTNLSCNNNSGSVSVSVTGGTIPYSYLWSNGSQNKSQSGLPAGTYSVSVADTNRCKSTSVTTISSRDSINRKYAIGDTAFCGIVFYVDPTVDSLNPCWSRYLICAFTDQDPGIYWYNGTYLTTNATTDGLFNKANGDQIIRVQGDSLYAAIVCARYLAGDSSCRGWYLPSREELKLMYTNLATKSIGGFANEGYWSSRESKKNKAWIVDFYDGRNISVNKANKYHIRAVREAIVR